MAEIREREHKKRLGDKENALYVYIQRAILTFA